MLLSCERIVCCTRVCAKILSQNTASATTKLTHLQRRADLPNCNVHKLRDPFLFLSGTECADAADHPPLILHAKEAFEELPFRSNRLVHPTEHVPDVSQRVVRVQLDRTGQAPRSSTRECVHEIC